MIESVLPPDTAEATRSVSRVLEQNATLDEAELQTLRERLQTIPMTARRLPTPTRTTAWRAESDLKRIPRLFEEGPALNRMEAVGAHYPDSLFP